MTGTTISSISHYKILEKIGEGGMGVVYRARDTHLDRTVAIKVLRPETVGDPERKRRFVQEAKAASALNHPNIITIHDIDTAGGVDFIVMEYADGKPLDRLIAGQGLPAKQALDYAVQISSALAAAHEAGIVHRDIKPANLVVTRQGYVKVLDFGLAKLTEAREWSREALTEGPTISSAGGDGGAVAADAPAIKLSGGPGTQHGVVLGTPAYMSPEQAEGKSVDARSDVFSLGAVIYEMLAGHRPFQGESRLSILTAILRDSPAPLKTIRPDAPPEMESILQRSLEKKPELRYPSAVELWKELAACQSRLITPEAGLRSILRRPQFALPLLLLLLAVAAASTWFWVRSSRVRWARNVALPEIARLVEKENFSAAFRLARQAERYIPEDPQLQRLRRDFSTPVTIRTTPPGAGVYIKDYLAVDAGWELIGKAPIENIRIPGGYLRCRITKEGFETAEGAFPGWSSPVLQFTLDPQGATPHGMVRVLGGRYQFRDAPPVELQDYWLDKYEVANKQFKEFVDQGGYQKREYWKHPFVKDGRVLSWEQAMAEFRDATGRPGPSAWELGTYPEGRSDFPASGVSWYEAAAYAQFAGKSLPTIYHWYKAAGLGLFSDILRLSNFGGQGPARIGSHQGLGPYGTYDMAGNVKEWCWNQTGSRRYVLGGAWNEPSYMFTAPDAQSPFERSATNGFRCAKYAGPLPEALTGPIERLSRDYTKEKPVTDDIFRFYQSIYTYDRTDLKAVVESVDDSSEHWRKEKISFNAAYGNERVIAYLFLPRNAAPPYQTVIYFPGAYALRVRSSENLVDMPQMAFIIRSGRALLHPIYKGTYERRLEDPYPGPNVLRDRTIQWSKDLGRSVDYLETRKDIDRERLAYYGLSMGASYGPLLTALEPRLKASVLLQGGFSLSRRPPEVDAIHFAPRARIPVLMLNGRDDFIFPVESSQIPMFRLLGTPEKDKRHALFDGGHVLPRMEVIKETLDWLDRYLGPVKTK